MRRAGSGPAAAAGVADWGKAAVAHAFALVLALMVAEAGAEWPAGS